jgi:tetratricopeptide (TPR) repeat protein
MTAIGSGVRARDRGIHRRWTPIVMPIVALLLVGLHPVDQDAAKAARRGDALAAERRYSEALDAYAAAAARCPGCPGVYLRQGRVYRAQGRYSEAWDAYLVAIQKGGISDQVTEELARLYRSRHSDERAAALLETLLARHAERSDLWVELGEAYLATGRVDQARAAFEGALKGNLDSRQRQFLYDRLGILCIDGDLYCALGNLSQAEKGPDVDLARDATRTIMALRALLEAKGSGHSEDDAALARAKLGEALYRRGELHMARRQFEAAVEMSPAYVDGHAYLGLVLSLLGEVDQATAHLKRAIELEPTYPLPYYLMGVHQVEHGWYITGRSYLEQAHDIDPTNPAICAAIADSYLRSGQPAYGVAEQWLHAAVDNAPDDPRFHLLLAHFYVDYMVDPSSMGVAVAQVAANLAPQSGEAQQTLGWAHYLSGNPDLALEPLLRARTLQPDDPWIHYRLAQVYSALGRHDEAQISYQQAIDLDWNGPVGERARGSIKERQDK